MSMTSIKPKKLLQDKKAAIDASVDSWLLNSSISLICICRSCCSWLAVMATWSVVNMVWG